MTVLVEISKKNDTETKHSLKRSIKLVIQRRSKLENDVEGMNSELANATTRCAKLIDEVLSREEVLASLQQDARLVMEGKEQSEVECKVLHMEAKALAD
jgi:hypothetical protein